MKVYNEFIKRVSPNLGKSELRLCMILLDICNKSECFVDKVDVYKHPLFTNTLKRKFSKIIKNITGENGKIICNKLTEIEPHVLFHEIKMEIFTIYVKINERVFYNFKKMGHMEIPAVLFEKFDHVYETKFIMWFKTWEKQKEETISIDALKMFLNKPYRTCDLITICIKPLLQKLLLNGIEIKMTKILNKNDRRFLNALHFKIVS